MEGAGARVSISVGGCRPKIIIVDRINACSGGKPFADQGHDGDFVWC